MPPWQCASCFLGLKETELMPLSSAWPYFFCLPVLQVWGCVTTPSYVRASPSVEHLPELQPVLGYRAAFGGRGGGGAPSSLSFTPLTTSCWVTSGHHLYSAELKLSALGLLLCCEEGDKTVAAVAMAAAANAARYSEHFTVFTYLIPMSTLWSRCCFYRHFTNDKTEAQRDVIT